MYDEDTGNRKPGPGGLPILRGKVPPACHRCPKKSPREAWQYELSPKNERTWALWQEMQATRVPDEWLEDDVLRRNFSVIQQAVEAAKNRETSIHEHRNLAMLQQLTTAVKGK